MADNCEKSKYICLCIHLEAGPRSADNRSRNYATARNNTIINEYIDYAFGSRSDRTNYLKLLDDVGKRGTDAVLVWKFNRFARSTKELINTLEEFRSSGWI